MTIAAEQESPLAEESTLVPRTVPFPDLRVGQPVKEIFSTLDRAACAGRLAEFAAMPSDPGAFTAIAYGNPFDRDLIGRVQTSDTDGEQVITFVTSLRKKLPVFFIITFVLSVWPGVWLTDSMLTTYFSWYPKEFWVTAAWYLPFCALALPLIPRMWRKSEAASHDAAHSVITKIATELGAEIIKEP